MGGGERAAAHVVREVVPLRVPERVGPPLVLNLADERVPEAARGDCMPGRALCGRSEGEATSRFLVFTL